jgi:hypothetical protein
VAAAVVVVVAAVVFFGAAGSVGWAAVACFVGFAGCPASAARTAGEVTSRVRSAERTLDRGFAAAWWTAGAVRTVREARVATCTSWTCGFATAFLGAFFLAGFRAARAAACTGAGAVVTGSVITVRSPDSVPSNRPGRSSKPATTAAVSAPVAACVAESFMLPPFEPTTTVNTLSARSTES